MSDTAPPPPEKNPESSMAGGRRSAWMAHVKKTMRANKGKKLSQVLKMASKTFKKAKKGGAASLTPALVGGKRRSRSRRA